MKKNHILLVALLMTPMCFPSFAADTGKTKCSKAECSLVSAIAQDGMAEVKLGELAEKQAKEQSVKDFAKHMVTDHSKANDKLKEAAAADGITLPADVNAKQKATFESLQKLNGTAFDERYTSEMLKGHKTAVAAITKETNIGAGSCKKWAAETLPTIKEHLKEIEALKTKVK